MNTLKSHLHVSLSIENHLTYTTHKLVILFTKKSRLTTQVVIEKRHILQITNCQAFVLVQAKASKAFYYGNSYNTSMNINVNVINWG